MEGSAARSDAELIHGSADDPDLFRVLYDRHAARIHAFFRHRTRDHDAALDLTAETFAQAWISRTRFRDLAAGSAAPWLFTIAKRVLIASVRKKQLEAKALDQLGVQLPTRATAPQPAAAWLDSLETDLRTALDDLPTQQREAIALRVLGGFSYSAIADRLGCTSTAARIRVSRGLKALRARMGTEQA